MPRVATDIPDDLYKKIEEEVKMGLFSDVSEAINAGLRKAYAKKSKAYLRWPAILGEPFERADNKVEWIEKFAFQKMRVSFSQ